MIEVLSSCMKIYDFFFFSINVSFQVLEFIICYFSFIFFNWYSYNAK